MAPTCASAEPRLVQAIKGQGNRAPCQRVVIVDAAISTGGKTRQGEHNRKDLSRLQ
jgi:hypothetical protein